MFGVGVSPGPGKQFQEVGDVGPPAPEMFSLAPLAARTLASFNCFESRGLSPGGRKFTGSGVRGAPRPREQFQEVAGVAPPAPGIVSRASVAARHPATRMIFPPTRQIFPGPPAGWWAYKNKSLLVGKIFSPCSDA